MILILLLSMVKSEFYTIHENGENNLALTITEDNVGFRKYDRTAEEQIIEMKNDEIMKNGKRMCSSPTSTHVELCSSGNPIDATFKPIEMNGLYVLKVRGNRVLAIGDYNVNTEMWDVKVIEERQAERGERHWFILSPIEISRSRFRRGRSWKREIGSK